MLVRLTGTLEEISPAGAIIATDDGSRAYEVLLPSALAVALADKVGQPITLHTIEFHEATSQGGSLIPRVAGFASRDDREFFRLFTTVKGVGTRKALKALALPVGQIAAAISQRDTKTLQQMPEIGKRLAETIVAELHGKADRFLAHSGAQPGTPTPAPGAPPAHLAPVIEALVRLGESRNEAHRLVDRVVEAKPELESPDEILAAAVSLR